jgi:hypothetical protein
MPNTQESVHVDIVDLTMSDEQIIPESQVPETPPEELERLQALQDQATIARIRNQIFGAGNLGPPPPKASGGAASGAAGGAAAKGKEEQLEGGEKRAAVVSTLDSVPNPQEAPSGSSSKDEPVAIKKEPKEPMPTDPEKLAEWRFCQGVLRKDDCPWSVDGRVMDCKWKGEFTGRCNECLKKVYIAQQEWMLQQKAQKELMLQAQVPSALSISEGQVHSVNPQEGSSSAQNDHHSKKKHKNQRVSQDCNFVSRKANAIAKQRASRRAAEEYRKWGHSKKGKQPKRLSSAAQEASRVARQQRQQKREQERADAQAQADAARAEADAAPDDDALAATDQGDQSQESQESQTSAVADDGATENLLKEVSDKLQMDLELEATLSPPPQQSNAEGEKPADDSSAAKKPPKSLAQRQRQRLKIMMRKQREQLEQHDADGQGSSRKKGGGSKSKKDDDDGMGSSSKNGEGSKKRKTATQSPQNGASEYEDDEAEESQEGKLSPDVHLIGSGKKPRGRITASEAGSATAKALFVGGKILKPGLFQYNVATGKILSRSPSPQTDRQRQVHKNKLRSKQHVHRMQELQRSQDEPSDDQRMQELQRSQDEPSDDQRMQKRQRSADEDSDDQRMQKRQRMADEGGQQQGEISDEY